MSLGHRRFDVLQADGANFALRLRDDVRRFEAAEHVRKDAVDRDRFAGQRFHAFVDFAARAVDVDLRFGAGGQIEHFGRIIAFVRTADEAMAQSQCGNDLSRAGDQRDDSRFGHGGTPRQARSASGCSAT